MLKIKLNFIITLAVVFVLAIPPKAEAIDLGPFNVSIQFCRDTRKIGAILNAFQLTMWPVAGLPGLVTGISMRTSPVIDACNMIIMLSMSDTLGAINASADLLNKLTAEKHDRQIQTTKMIFSLGNSFYNLKTGERRAGSGESMYVATRIGQFMQKYGRAQKKWAAEDKAKAEEEDEKRRINDLANAAKDRAILSEMISCPDDSKNPNFAAINKEKFMPAYAKIEKAERDLMFIQGKLESVAIKFIPTFAQYQKFKKDLSNAIVNGVRYTQTSNGTKKIDNFVKTGQVDAEGVAVKENRPKTVETFTYTAREESRHFFALRGHNPSYKAWVRRYWAETEKNHGTAEGIKEEFKTVNFDCAPESIAADLDINDPTSDEEFELRSQRCEESKAVNQKSAELMYQNMIEYLRNSLIRYKRANAELWTLDSVHRGKNRVISIANNTDLSEEKVSCSSELQIADLQFLTLKHEETNAKYNSIIAEEAIRQNMIIEKENEDKIEAEKRARFEDEKRVQIAEENRRSLINTPKTIDLRDGK